MRSEKSAIRGTLGAGVDAGRGKPRPYKGENA
jgi:hypothetical protein